MKMCEYMSICPIYNRYKTEDLKNSYIRKYCNGDYELCKRWKLKYRGEEVLYNLLPDGNRVRNFYHHS